MHCLKYSHGGLFSRKNEEEKMPITDFLKQNAEKWPNDVALVEINPENQESASTWKEYDLVQTKPHVGYRREITWLDFEYQSNRFANLLTVKGIKKGDKVAILMMNCLEWLPIYFGVLKSGAIAVPLNYRYTADEIKYCLELAECTKLIFGPEFTGRVEQIFGTVPKVNEYIYVGADCPTFATDYHTIYPMCSKKEPGIEIKDEDYGAIYFSSGTTGFPKAILHDHAGLVSAAKLEQSHHGQQKDDVFLCIPPLYHTGAKFHWMGSLVVGSKGVLLKGVKPKWIIDTVSREKCTIVWLLVPWAQDIMDSIDSGEIKLDEYELSQWRLMHIGAQPVPKSLIKRWKGFFPNHEYDTNYGLSESLGPGCVHLGIGNIHKVGAIGIPGDGWKCKIVNENNEIVKQGDVGELCVQGKGVMKCYFNDPDATSQALIDGWLHTGDMARQDEDGFYYLVDRKKDVIITGGENTYPVQIEDFLRQNNEIKDVAVIGIPDERLGEIIAAVIELKPGSTCTEEDINNFCLGMPRYKRPRKIIFADVPRNPTGKIEKPLLRKMYAGENLVEQQTQR